METLLLAVLTAIVPARDYQRQSLVGIARMRVIVESSGDAKADGLSENQIKTDVELRLRSAGVRIGDEFNAFLYVNIAVLNIRGNIVRLQQR